MALNNNMPQKNSPQQIPQNPQQKEPSRKKARFTFKAVVKNTVSGLVIGSSMLVPGVSGGTMAIILGIYDSLINAVSTIFKRFTYNFLFILQVAVGGIAGILLFSHMILGLINKFEYPMMYLFMGAMLGSIPSLYRKGKIKKFNPLYLLWIIIGGGLVYAMNFLPKNKFSTMPTNFQSYVMLFLCGAVIAVALILPGISTSHILLVMGMYESVWSAVSDLNFLYLFPIFLGVMAGVLLTTKILDSAMRRFPAQTHLLIIGFVLASLADIFPGIPNNYSIVACAAGLIFGAGGIYLISK